jgi:hypothetical protein
VDQRTILDIHTEIRAGLKARDRIRIDFREKKYPCRVLENGNFLELSPKRMAGFPTLKEETITDHDVGFGSFTIDGTLMLPLNKE